MKALTLYALKAIRKDLQMEIEYVRHFAVECIGTMGDRQRIRWRNALDDAIKTLEKLPHE